MPTKTWFATQIYDAQLQTVAKKREQTKFNRDLLTQCYQLRSIDEAGIDWSQKNYIGGYTSYASANDLHLRFSDFSHLEKLIRRHVQNYINSLEFDIPKNDLTMSTCWVNIMPKYTYHSMHIHPHSVISGTYYVQVPKGSSAIKFEDPRHGFLMSAPPKKQNCKPQSKGFVLYHPTPGQVVLFESWMRHEVPPNMAEQDRVSISFNYDWC